MDLQRDETFDPEAPLEIHVVVQLGEQGVEVVPLGGGVGRRLLRCGLGLRRC